MTTRAALAVRKMFPGAYGYRVATPRTPITTQQKHKPMCRTFNLRWDGPTSTTWHVPGGVTSIYLVLAAPGVIADVSGDPGDYDSYGWLITAPVVAVTPGETLSIEIGDTSHGITGGSGAYPGGDGGTGPGSPVFFPTYPGNGRGGSAGTAVSCLADTFVAGGAGGGQADATVGDSDLDNFGGSAGWPDGDGGEDDVPTGGAGLGGTSSAGGAAGVATPGFGTDGTAGSAGAGGDGGNGLVNPGTWGGHGGGGGLYGGGGAAGASNDGGGGGSSSHSGEENDGSQTLSGLLDQGFVSISYEICG